MTNRHNNKRVVKGGKAFTELKAPLGKREIELGKGQRVRHVARLDNEIDQLIKRKEKLLAKIVEDDKVLAAIESGGNYAG
jgi:hypothetical protein